MKPCAALLCVFALDIKLLSGMYVSVRSRKPVDDWLREPSCCSIDKDAASE